MLPIPWRSRSFALLAVLVWVACVCPPARLPTPAAWAGPAPRPDDPPVFLARKLSEDQLITLSSLVPLVHPKGILLCDTPASTPANRAFLDAARPSRVLPIGSYSDGTADLKGRLGLTATPLAWPSGPPEAVWKALVPRADAVVVCPVSSRRLLLQAACLAGALRAPLFAMQGTEAEVSQLRDWIEHWRPSQIWAVASTEKPCRTLPFQEKVRSLPDEEAIQSAYLRQLACDGPIRTLVVANPADTRRGLGAMSLLAPLLAVQRRALLLLTNEAGDDTVPLVYQAVKRPELAEADYLIFAADLQSIDMERRPNPAAGKDAFIEMEPLTPRGDEPVSFATGRWFNEDTGLALLILARQRLLPPAGSRRSVLVASNPGGGLPMLELFSRHTARELRNCGYELTTRFGRDVTREELRCLLPDHDIFLWEGHHNTLMRDYEFQSWNEPLRPAFIFLQSCLALTDAKVQPLWQRGALGVVGSSTRIYSATGGAFSLAFFDALLYERQTLGGSLRQAKNFLLTYAALKEKRLGKDAHLTGANLRSAWAFTLWGDPTLTLPAPQPPKEALPAVSHRVQGRTIVVNVPEATYERINTGKYESRMRPNARLAGLLTRDPDEATGRLVSLIFAEVSLKEAGPGQTPRLRSRLPESCWAFCWDARRRCGYLLVAPRSRDQGELRFQVEWEREEEARSE